MDIFDTIREHLHLEQKYSGAKVNQDTIRRMKASIANRKDMGSMSAAWQDPKRKRYFTKEKSDLSELSLKSALKNLRKLNVVEPSRETRRAATQKKLQLRRAKAKLEVKKSTEKIMKSNKAKARSSSIRVYDKQLKRIEHKPKQIEYKPGR